MYLFGIPLDVSNESGIYYIKIDNGIWIVNMIQMSRASSINPRINPKGKWKKDNLGTQKSQNIFPSQIFLSQGQIVKLLFSSPLSIEIGIFIDILIWPGFLLWIGSAISNLNRIGIWDWMRANDHSHLMNRIHNHLTNKDNILLKTRSEFPSWFRFGFVWDQRFGFPSPPGFGLIGTRDSSSHHHHDLVCMIPATWVPISTRIGLYGTSDSNSHHHQDSGFHHSLN